jgi:ribonuclease BN (tRNA processing enzyme)
VVDIAVVARRVTVLGSCGVWPEAGRAASGFLLEYDGFRLVLDLGYATLPRLLAHCPDGDVDAVVVTHEHPDHCVDLHGLYRVRYFAPERPPPLPLYCPPGVMSRLRPLEPDGDLADVFAVSDLPGSYEVGPFHLETVMLPHYVPNAGIRLTASDVTVAYTGDTGPDDALAALGADADLFIVEATGQVEGVGALREPTEPRYHLRASDAGLWARRAGVRRLMLTHFWPGIDRTVSRVEAAARFDGDILLADEDLVVPLVGHPRGE